MVRCLCICPYKHSLLSLPPSLSSSFLPSSLPSSLCSPSFYWKSNHCTKANWCLCQQPFGNRLSRRMESTEGGSPSPKSPWPSTRLPCGREASANPRVSFQPPPAGLFTKHLYSADMGRLLRLSLLCTLSNTKVSPWGRWGRKDLSAEGLPRGKMQCHSLHLFPVCRVSIALFLSFHGADCLILKAGEKESFL